MSEIELIFSAWPFLLVGILVYLIMYFFLKVGALLWKIKWTWLRKTLKVLDAAHPWLPWAFGAGIGAIPVLPKPALVLALPESYHVWSMVFLGLLAGALYERIWKSVQQGLEARGIDISLDMPPKEQKKLKVS